MTPPTFPCNRVPNYKAFDQFDYPKSKSLWHIPPDRFGNKWFDNSRFWLQRTTNDTFYEDGWFF